jgi:hypothetical protein
MKRHELKSNEKKEYPVIRYKLPFMLQTFLHLTSGECVPPDKKNKKEYKKFFLTYIRWSLQYYLDAGDDELISGMGMPQIDEITDWGSE